MDIQDGSYEAAEQEEYEITMYDGTKYSTQDQSLLAAESTFQGQLIDISDYHTYDHRSFQESQMSLLL